MPARFTATFGGVYRFLLNKWYFDEIYHLLFVRSAFWFGRLFWQRGDVGLVDRFGPNGFAAAVQVGSRAAVRFQAGQLANYALVMLLGLVGFATWAILG